MATTNYITTNELITLWRPMKPEEITKANAIIPMVCATLRTEAAKVGIDLDSMVEEDEDFELVAKSVTCDIVTRMMTANVNQEAMSQFSQTAGSYTVSGSYLSPGGGMFIKKSELARLGIKRQRFGGMNVYTGD